MGRRKGDVSRFGRGTWQLGRQCREEQVGQRCLYLRPLQILASQLDTQWIASGSRSVMYSFLGSDFHVLGWYHRH